MLKGKRVNKMTLIIAAVAIVLLVIGGSMVFGNYVSIRGQHLNTYTHSSGGGMTGGYSRKTVKRYGDQALISFVSAEWYAQDPDVEEYMVDAAVLDELEEVVRKNGMNFWNRKKFTRMFVNDGESDSYYFYFDDSDISFSSQIFPEKYSRKLAGLDAVISKYVASAEMLPGLVPSVTDEEMMYELPKDELVIYVYSYAGNTLGVKILNGKNEDIEIYEKYKLVNADTGAVLAQGDTPYGNIIIEQTMTDMDIRLKERLDAGSYRLVFGSLVVPFVIG